MKKIFNLFFALAVFFSFSGIVEAKMLTPDEVFSDFQTTFIEPMNTYGGELRAENNTASKTYTVYASNEPIITFNYTDGYVEYDNRATVIDQSNMESELGAMFCYDAMVNSILKLSGYGDKTIKSEEFPYLEDTFEPYGYQVEFEHHDFEGNEENGSWSISGDYIKYFKMSFDTEKIDALMNRYGIDKEEYYNSNNEDNKNDFYEFVIENMNVNIEFEEVGTNEVTLLFSAGSYYSEDKVEVLCDIYRSTSEDGKFEKITKEPVSCVNKSTYKDTGLSPNTSYYYYTKFADNNRTSSVFKVTTLPLATGAATNNTKESTANANAGNKDTVKNPETGVVTYTIASLAVIIGSVGALLYSRRKNAFKNL